MPSISVISQDSRFLGREVGQILTAVGQPYDDHLFVDREPGHLSGAAFHFEGEGWLYIYIDESTQQPGYNPERKWSLDRFKDETATELEWEED